MDLIVESMKRLTPEVISEFNEKDANGQYKYDRIVVKRAFYSGMHQIDCVLCRTSKGEYEKGITLTQLKSSIAYITISNSVDYDSIIKPTEVTLDKKHYIRAQSSHVIGVSSYNGASCDTYLVYEAAIIIPI